MKQKFVHLQLWTIRFPVMAIVSICHRISGVVLFLLFPFFLWIAGLTLESPMHFASFYEYLEHSSIKFALWIFFSAFFYHVFAGIRHLLMDAHILSESKCVGRFTSYVVLFASVVSAVWLGVCLW